MRTSSTMASGFSLPMVEATLNTFSLLVTKNPLALRYTAVRSIRLWSSSINRIRGRVGGFRLGVAVRPGMLGGVVGRIVGDVDGFALGVGPGLTLVVGAGFALGRAVGFVVGGVVGFTLGGIVPKSCVSTRSAPPMWRRGYPSSRRCVGGARTGAEAPARCRICQTDA